MFYVYTHICVTYKEGVWELYVTWTRRGDEQENLHHYTVSWYFFSYYYEKLDGLGMWLA